jgi:hypothetical protein
MNEDLAVNVPLAGGNLAKIKHLPVTSAAKTLGSMTCPAGLNKADIKGMHQEWVDRITNLSRRNTWFMVDRQFRLRLGYGICNDIATWEELDSCLTKGLLAIGPKWRCQTICNDYTKAIV